MAFLAGLAASGTITSALGLVTKAAFQDSEGGLRKGACMFLFLLKKKKNLVDCLLSLFILDQFDRRLLTWQFIKQVQKETENK